MLGMVLHDLASVCSAVGVWLNTAEHGSEHVKYAVKLWKHVMLQRALHNQCISVSVYVFYVCLCLCVCLCNCVSVSTSIRLQKFPDCGISPNLHLD